MSCCITNEGSKLKVTLTFLRDQLLYDIKNYAYIESHVMAPDTEHAKHMVADVGEDGNVDRVTRVLDLGVSMCREMLYPWAKKSIGNMAYDDVFAERKQYVIEMNVPTTMSQTTLTFVERLIHEYLVCRGVADWLSITNPQKSETWLEKAAEAEDEIRTAIHSRMERTRIKQHFLD
jgi:hypothetical protein